MAQIQVQCCVPNLGIDQTANRTASEVLIQIFADEFGIQSKLINYAVNTNGPRFTQLALFFCAQAKEMKCLLHETAEQIRTLGVRVPNVTEIMKQCNVSPTPTDWVDEDLMMKDYLREIEKLVQMITSERTKLVNVKEFVIEDVLLDVIKKLRTMAWKARAHLENPHPSGMMSSQ